MIYRKSLEIRPNKMCLVHAENTHVNFRLYAIIFIHYCCCYHHVRVLDCVMYRIH